MAPTFAGRELRFRLLGPVTAEGPAGPVALGGQRQRGVLAMLLLDAGSVVSTSQLLAGVWGDTALRDGTATLAVSIARLRRALDDVLPGTGGRALRFQRPGYLLDVDRATVDVHRFAALAAEGSTRLAAADVEGASVLLRAALELWRGPPLADIEHAPFVDTERADLTERRLGVLDHRIDADLAAGRHAELVPELQRLVAVEPFRERTTGQLMVALYRNGRQREALEAYERLRATLADELGIDPSPELAAVHTALLRQGLDEETPHQEAAVMSPAVTSVRVPTNLPYPVTSFVGRAAELDHVRRSVRTSRLVTLVGTAGAGKTRLAVEAARGLLAEHPDGVWLVELGPLTAAADVVHAVATPLGVADLGAAKPLATLVDALGDQEVLLIVDSCEHLLDEVAGVTATLLRRCGGLRVLATSREALGVAGESVLVVRPLGLPPSGADLDALLASEAGRLLYERAQTAALGSADQPAEAAALARISRELDGIPLALELAAARLRAMTPAELVEQLADRFAVLREQAEGGPAHHRTLLATVAWSHDLLDPDARTLFARLAVFAGNFSLTAVEALCEDLPQRIVAPLLGELAAKSLIEVEPPALGGHRRYRLLETLGAFARRQLAGDLALLESLRRAHALHFAAVAEAAEAHLRGPDEAAWLERLDADLDNFRAALAWALDTGDAVVAHRLVAGLGWYWLRSSRVQEGWLRTQEALAGHPAGRGAELGRALFAAGMLAYAAVSLEECAGAMTHSAKLLDAAGDPGGAAWAGLYEAVAGMLTGTGGDAGVVDASCATFRALGLRPQEAEALVVAGMAARLAGDSEAALARLAEAEQVARECGHAWAHGSALRVAAKVAVDRAEGPRAVELARKALRTDGLGRDTATALACLEVLAGGLAVAGEHRRAARLLGAAEAISEAIGYRLYAVDPVDAARHAQLIREGLTDEAFAAARAEGAALSLDEARDEALAPSNHGGPRGSISM